MKKGCFFTVICILTIIIGVAFYLFKNHKVSFEGIIKPYIVKSISKDLDKKFAKLGATPQKDSLQSAVKRFLAAIKKDRDFSFDSSKSVIERIELTLENERLDSFEVAKVTDLINKNLNSIYERQKKNGN